MDASSKEGLLDYKKCILRAVIDGRLDPATARAAVELASSIKKDWDAANLDTQGPDLQGTGGLLEQALQAGRKRNLVMAQRVVCAEAPEQRQVEDHSPLVAPDCDDLQDHITSDAEDEVPEVPQEDVVHCPDCDQLWEGGSEPADSEMIPVAGRSESATASPSAETEAHPEPSNQSGEEPGDDSLESASEALVAGEEPELMEESFPREADPEAQEDQDTEMGLTESQSPYRRPRIVHGPPPADPRIAAQTALKATVAELTSRMFHRP